MQSYKLVRFQEETCRSFISQFTNVLTEKGCNATLLAFIKARIVRNVIIRYFQQSKTHALEVRLEQFIERDLRLDEITSLMTYVTGCKI